MIMMMMMVVIVMIMVKHAAFLTATTAMNYTSLPHLKRANVYAQAKGE